MLDEVQMLQEFEEVLNSLLHIRNADICATGSNSKCLSKDVITEFRGRGDEIHIYPLTFKEFMNCLTNLFEETYLKDIIERHYIEKNIGVRRSG